MTVRMTATKESSGGGFPFPGGGDMPFSAEVTPLADEPAGPGGPGGGGFPGGGMPPFGGGGTETTTLDYEITIVVAGESTGGETEITIGDLADQIGDLADRIDGLEQGGETTDGGNNTAALALAGVSLGVAVLAGAAAVVIAVKSRKKD